jgi:hypothetical protein
LTRPNEYRWVFGSKNHIEFPQGGAPVNLLGTDPTQIDTVEGCASISDATGALLFYTDGRALWDASHSQIATGLGGSSSASHSAIIVPPPAGGSIYHVFTVGDWDNSQADTTPLLHTQVTVNPVTVVSAAQVVSGSAPRVGEQLIAVPTQDCGGWWILCLGFDDRELHAFELQGDTGIVQGPQRSAYPDAAYIFCAKASPDGKRLAFSNPGQHSVDIFDFDRSTGLATPVFQAPTNGNRARRVYGIEFSPNSLFCVFHAVDLCWRD